MFTEQWPRYHVMDNTNPDPDVPGMAERTNAYVRMGDTAGCLLLCVNVIVTTEIELNVIHILTCVSVEHGKVNGFHGTLMACDVIGSGCVISGRQLCYSITRSSSAALSMRVCLRQLSFTDSLPT